MLDIRTTIGSFVDNWKLLSSHTMQVRTLGLICYKRREIREVTDLVSGPLPPLHTLAIEQGPLSHFPFPNLTHFEISEPGKRFHISQLLDFLEVSPVLQRVVVATRALDRAGAYPGDRIVFLPNVKEITLHMGVSTAASKLGYRIATHLSCPSAKSTWFMHSEDPERIADVGDVFPDPVAWGPIASQYTTSPVEEVTLKMIEIPSITYGLILRSPDASIIELYFRPKVAGGGIDPRPLQVHTKVFTRAIQTILDHPQLANIKRLHIHHDFQFNPSEPNRDIEVRIRQLFGSLNLLDELTIHDCDLRLYLHPRVFGPTHPSEELMEFPPTKVFTILHPMDFTCYQFLKIVEVAMSQCLLGKPFERLVFHGVTLPVGMKRRLEAWVGSVESYDEGELSNCQFCRSGHPCGIGP